MTGVTFHDLTPEHRAAVEDAVQRLVRINANISELKEQAEGLKAFLRTSLPEARQENVAGVRLTIATRKVFSPEKAAEILPPEVLAGITVAKVDAARARALLSPDVYAACQVEQEAQVRIA